ncbi:MAG: ribosome silencing factor [Bacteriovoracaceae bacterium]|jgi:ribosome-associated protein|nr:ribosome silencing factor [Bacteriovoracaceae bacterium]
MSVEFVEKNVNEIMDDKSLDFPRNMALASAWVLGNLKGVNLKILDVTKTSSLSDYYVLASATNINQASSMADTLTKELIRRGHKVFSKEGFYADSDWFLIDMGDVIVHIFMDYSRSVYDLDNLWDEAQGVEIPTSYYFEEGDALSTVTTESKDYF